MGIRLFRAAFVTLLLLYTVTRCQAESYRGWDCAKLEGLKAQGWTDEALEAKAKELKVPAWVIRAAKRRCR